MVSSLIHIHKKTFFYFKVLEALKPNKFTNILWNVILCNQYSLGLSKWSWWSDYLLLKYGFFFFFFTIKVLYKIIICIGYFSHCTITQNCIRLNRINPGHWFLIPKMYLHLTFILGRSSVAYALNDNRYPTIWNVTKNEIIINNFWG